MKNKDIKLCILGLGYVGLPLAVEFSKVRNVIGFDVNSYRIQELKSNIDSTLETSTQELEQSENLTLTTKISDLKDCNCFIITVPTPIDCNKNPDLSAIFTVTNDLACILKKGDIVIYESTVYPGLTEEVCMPILEKNSNLIFNKDFFCGYSPERINPGDKNHKLKDIVKVTSGSNKATAIIIDDLYRSIIIAGTHMAPSIKVAEAAKVIENTQRDLNIALMNELSLIFDIMKIDTNEVLEAAGTKWNFLPFKPGLVGGHCIGVDPYYLTHKAQSIGYDPKIILSGRELNDQMTSHVVKKAIENAKNHLDKKPRELNILIMGIAFKENCPDTRNSRCIDMINEFDDLGCNVEAYDPWVNSDDTKKNYSIEVTKSPKNNFYDILILAVPHSNFIELGSQSIKKYGHKDCIFFDIKGVFKKSESDFRL